MANTFAPRGLRANGNTFAPAVAPQYDQSTDFTQQANDNALGQGIAGSLLGIGSGIKGLGASTAGALGYSDAAQRMYDAAKEDEQAAARVGPRVRSLRDIRSASDVANYALGTVGGALPYAPLAFGGAGLGRLAGGAAGAELGGMAALHPVLAGQEALRMHEDPAAAGMSPQEQFLRSQGTALGQDAAAALAPTVLTGRIANRIAAPTTLRQAAKNFGADVATSTSAGAASMGGMDVAGQVGQMSYDPNKHYDPSQTGEALTQGAIMGGALAVPHAGLATGLDLAAGAGGLAKKGAGTVADLAVQGSGGAAETIGKAASDAKGKVLDTLDRVLNRPKDPDVDALMAPQTGMDPAAIQADDTIKHAAAERKAAQLLDPAANVPGSVREAAQTYAQGTKTQDAWKPLAEALKTWKQGSTFKEGVDQFTDLVGSTASKITGALKKNAQPTDVDTFSRILADELFKATGIRHPDVVEQQTLAASTEAMRKWIGSWSEDKPLDVSHGMFAALHKMFEDPAATVSAAYDLMRQEGLVKSDATKADVVEQLKALNGGAQSAAGTLAQYLRPSAKEQYGVGDQDMEHLARHIQNMIAEGGLKKNDATLTELFGANKEEALAAFQSQMPERSSTHVAETEGDDRSPQLSDEGISSNAQDPNVVGEDTVWHGYGAKPYDTAGKIVDIDKETGEITEKGTHDAHATAKAADLQAKYGSTVKRQGYMDYLREQHAGNSDALIKHATDFVAEHGPDLPLEQQAQAEANLNKRFFMLREERAKDKGEAHDIPADEFKTLTPGAKANRWAEATGKANENGGIERGKIWLERVDARDENGKPTKVTKFATSTAKIIKRMAEAGKAEGSAHEERGLAGQKDMLMQGLTSLLHAKDKDGNFVLTGRVGFMDKPGMREPDWNSKEIPDGLKLFSSDQKATLGAAKAESKRANVVEYQDRLARNIERDATGADAIDSATRTYFEMNPDVHAAILRAIKEKKLDAYLKHASGEVLSVLDNEAQRYKETQQAAREAGPKPMANKTESVPGKEVVETTTRDNQGNLFGSKKLAQESARAGDRVIKDDEGHWAIIRERATSVRRATEIPLETEEMGSAEEGPRITDEPPAGKGNELHPKRDDTKAAERKLFEEKYTAAKKLENADRAAKKLEAANPTAPRAKRALNTDALDEFLENADSSSAAIRANINRNRAEHGEEPIPDSQPVRGTDGLFTAAQSAAAKGEKAPIRSAQTDKSSDKAPQASDKVTEFVAATLQKGIPAFNAMLRKATPEQTAKIREALKKMAQSDARALVALKTMGEEPPTKTSDNHPTNAGKTSGDGKKLNAMSTRVHEELGKPGFGATHDSPIRHEGKFDWRKNIGKGEGNAAFGAGTYLSTANGVHKSYKHQFTAQTRRALSVDGEQISEPYNRSSKYQKLTEAERTIVHVAGQYPDAFGAELHTKAKEDALFQAEIMLSQTLESLVDAVPEREGEKLEMAYGMARNEHTGEVFRFREPDYAALRQLANKYGELRPALDQMDAVTALQSEIDKIDLGRFGRSEGGRNSVVSPTYHVTVNAKPEEMLDWDKPMSGQSQHVEGALYRLFEEKELGNPDDIGGPQGAKGGRIYAELAKELGSQRAASDALQEYGIVGHTFDAVGGKESQFRNHVIYDDSRIETNYVEFNKQGPQPDAPRATPEELKAANDHIDKTLGAAMKREFVETLGGHSAEWSPEAQGNVIRIATNAVGGVHTNAVHESMHEFFNRLTKGGQTEARDLLLRAASNAITTRSLERILAEHPEALASLKDPEERLAYAYQFWEAGHPELKLGEKASTLFEKVAKFLRKVTGLLRDDEKTEALFRQFSEGKLQDASAAGEVIAKLNNSEKRVAAVARVMEPFRRHSIDWVGSAEDNLLKSANPHLQELGADYADHNNGYIQAADRSEKQWMGKLKSVLQAHDKDDIKAAVDGLQTGKLSSDAKIRAVQEGVRSVLDEMHPYLTKAGVSAMNEETGKWTVIKKIKDYFPRSWDTEELSARGAEFIERLHKFHEKDLQGIADSANAARAAAADLSEMNANQRAEHDAGVGNLTADNIAYSIFQRLIDSNGQHDLAEDGYSLGYSPMMKAVNRRSLNWLDMTQFHDFQNKDLTNIMSTYVMQATKRAEYTRRFGPDGGIVQGKMDKALAHEVDGLMKGDPKLSRDDATVTALKKLKPAQRAIMAMEGTLGHDISPTLRKAQGWVLAYQNWRMLPMALFSNLTDPLGVLVRGGTMDDTFKAYKSGLQDVVNSWRGKDREDNLMHMSEAIGTLDAHGYMSSMGQMMNSLYMAGGAKRMNDTLFRLNGMESLNRSMRGSATQAAIGFIKRHATEPNEHSKRLLDELHLDADYVKSKMGWDGKKEKWSDAAQGLDVTDPRIQNAVAQWVNEAILRPNSALRPSRLSDPHWALIGHFKGFMYAMHKQILQRAAKEARLGNYTAASTLALGYVPVMFAADMTKLIIQNGLAGNAKLPAWWEGMDAKDHYIYAAERAGLAGPAQMGRDAFEYGPAAVGGPTAEQVLGAFTDPLGKTATGALPWSQFFASAQRAVND